MPTPNDSIPTIRVGLRPDGRLCLVLPGLDAHGESAAVSDKALVRILREVLGTMEAAAEGPQPKIGQRGAPTKEQLRAMAAEMERGATPHQRTRHVEVRKIVKHGDVQVQRRVGLHHCACGFSGSMGETARHIQLHWPTYPQKQPPAGFPHREVSGQAKSAEAKLAEWRTSDAGKAASGKVEIDL